jgi:hypothetical protein
MALVGHSDLGSSHLIYSFIHQVLPGEGEFRSIDLKLRTQAISRRLLGAFTGILEVMEICSILTINDESVMVDAASLQDWKKFIPNEQLGIQIASCLFAHIDEHYKRNPFTSPTNLIFEPSYDMYSISNSLIPAEFLPVRHFLVESGILLPNTNTSSVLINTEYWTIWSSLIIDKADEYSSGDNHQNDMTLEELLSLNDHLRQIGKEGEDWVLAYEKERMRNHSRVDMIKIISEHSVKSGYDIISFENIDSVEYDRYIEVKSYSKNLGFYWSKNEVNTARKKGENYCLYLVNRDKMEENNYVPTIITNAFFEVFQNKSWHKEAETYFVKHSK